MYINGVQSGYGTMELRNRQKAAQLENQSRQDPFLIQDTMSLSTEAMNLAGTAGRTTGTKANALAEEDNSESAKKEGVRKSLVSMMLDSIFMFTLEEEKAKPSTSNIGEESATEGDTGGLTESDAKDVRKIMDDMMTGNVEIADLPEALLAMSSGKAPGSARTAGKGRNSS